MRRLLTCIPRYWQRTEIFNHLYAAERKEETSQKTIRDAYDRRKDPNSAKNWRVVCDLDNPSDEEKLRRRAIRDELMVTIRGAMTALNYEDAGAASLPDPPSPAPPATPGPAAPVSPGRPALPIVQDTSWNPEHEHTAIEMIHHRECAWNGDVGGLRSANPGNYLDHDNDVYKLGGKAYRCLTGIDIYEDVMICNRDVCTFCNDNLDKDSTPDVPNILKGRPFVHASDCGPPNLEGRESGLLRFRGSEKPASEYGLPFYMWTPSVEFLDREGRVKAVQVVMCQAAYCAECSGQEKVDRFKARVSRG